MTYLQFFTKLVSEYKKINQRIRCRPRSRNWLSFGTGMTGLKFGWAFKGTQREKEFLAELFIHGEKAKNITII